MLWSPSSLGLLLLLAGPCALADTSPSSSSFITGVYFAESPQLSASLLLSNSPVDVYYIQSDSPWITNSCYQQIKSFQFPVTANYSKLVNSKNSDSVVLLNCAIDGAFPQDIAQLAYNLGFKAMLWTTGWGTAGYSAQSLWKSKGLLAIPVVEISKDSFVVTQRPSSILLDSTSPTSFQTPNSKTSWIVVQSPLFVAYFVLCVAKLIECCDRLKRHVASNFESGQLTAATTVLICETLSPIFGIIFLVDFQGQFHILSHPIWYSGLIIPIMLTFSSTSILALTLVSAEAAFFGERFARDRNFVLYGVLVLFMGISVTNMVCFGWRIYDHPYVPLVSHLSCAFLQFAIGMFFFFTKSRILRSIEKMATATTSANNQDLLRAQQRDLHRLVSFLYLAGFSMVAYEILYVLRSIFELLGMFEAMIFISHFAQICHMCTGIFQVLSLPRFPTLPSSAAKPNPSRKMSQVFTETTNPLSSRRKSSVFLKIDSDVLLMFQK